MEPYKVHWADGAVQSIHSLRPGKIIHILKTLGFADEKDPGRYNPLAGYAHAQSQSILILR